MKSNESKTIAKYKFIVNLFLKNKKKVVIGVAVLGLIATILLFVLENKIQNLYERKIAINISYAQFVPLDAFVRLSNPWPGISDENLRVIYRNAYFYIHEQEPTGEMLMKITSRGSYYDEIESLTKNSNTAKNEIIKEINKKQIYQLFCFITLLITQLLEVGFLFKK
jgi:hypothetical protein